MRRFALSVPFHLPNVMERLKIIDIYAQHLHGKDLTMLARSSETLETLSGRDIKDFCIQTERKWAMHLIRNGKTEKVTPPPAVVYQEVLRNRCGRLQEGRGLAYLRRKADRRLCKSRSVSRVC